MTRIAAIWLSALLVCAPAVVAQSKKKEPTVRSVSGVVKTSDDKLAVGAVVQLTDTKTKQVRSFYTQDHGEKLRGPFFSGGTESEGQFSVYFTLDVTRKATGQRLTLEEVALYTVKNDKIAREQFFYDGDH